MLVLTLFIMGLSTFTIGLLPTYERIGVLAPMLLFLLRIIQGIGLGGEWGGASLMVLEHAPADRRGFYTSFVQIGFPIGLVLATLVPLGYRPLDEWMTRGTWHDPTWTRVCEHGATLLALAIDRWQTSGIIFKFGKEWSRRMGWSGRA